MSLSGAISVHIGPQFRINISNTNDAWREVILSDGSVIGDENVSRRRRFRSQLLRGRFLRGRIICEKT